MTAYAIETEKLTKVYKPGTSILNYFSHTEQFRKKIWALYDISIQVPQGEVFALLGPNGAGKTTLIKILTTLLRPDAGKARVHGFDVVRRSKQAKRTLSLVVGEERSFYWRLTCRQNLEFFGTLYGFPQKILEQRIEKAARFFGIPDLDIRYQECSTGTKYRLALARSFIADARLLFMDEPTRSLDFNAANKLRWLIKERLKKDPDLTIFFSTHNIREAELIADRIAIIDQGEIRACGTLEELRNRIGNPQATLEEVFQVLTIGTSVRGTHNVLHAQFTS